MHLTVSSLSDGTGGCYNDGGSGASASTLCGFTMHYLMSLVINRLIEFVFHALLASCRDKISGLGG